MSSLRWTLLAIGLALSSSPAAAQELECDQVEELDRFKTLRRMSLHLQGKPPSYEEYMALENEVDIPEATIDAMLASEGFRQQMRHYFDSRLWPNNIGIAYGYYTLRLTHDRQRATNFLAVKAGPRNEAWRGTKLVANRHCGEFEHGTTDDTDWECYDEPCTEPLGIHNAKPVSTREICEPDDATDCWFQDGWVTVNPYWDPQTDYQICAYDAQTRRMSEYTQSDDPIDCSTRYHIYATDQTGGLAPDCGCGPNLDWCYSPTYSYDGLNTNNEISRQLREQTLRSIDDVTVGGFPYSDLLTSKRVHMSGAVEFFWQNLSHSNNLRPYAMNTDGWPEMPDEPTWNTEDWWVDQRTGDHSGVLTLPSFLLRNSFNRSRANHARLVFTGEYFAPPDNQDLGGDPESPDLTKRTGCRGCHQVLEPEAAYFAKFAENGISQVSELPDYDERCTNPAWDTTCRRFYGFDETFPRPGFKITHQLADDDGTPSHQAVAANLETGPTGFANVIIGDGRFQAHAVTEMFTHLMGRLFILDPDDPYNEIALRDQFIADFTASDAAGEASLPALVKSIVLLPEYRRAR